MNIDKCFEIADYLQQTEPVDYDEQKAGAVAIWWLIEQLKKASELTDEEILKTASNMFHYSEYKLVIQFARAILKKVSEK
jgi:nitrate reductase gamma subunit